MSQQQFTEENYREHAIDYLDGLLDAPQALRFEEALAQHPDWSNYVEDLRATWRNARRALVAGSQQAPKRVRAHVLAEAAKRAAVLRAVPTAAKSVPADSLWERVKRGLLARPWVAPAFVATAAVGLYVFSQQSLENSRPSLVNGGKLRQEAPALLSPTPEPQAPLSEPEVTLGSAPREEAPKRKPAPAKSRRREANMREGADDSRSKDEGMEFKRLAPSALNEPAAESVGGRADLGAARGKASASGAAGPQGDVKGFAAPPPGWAAPATASAPAAPAPEDDADEAPRDKAPLSRAAAVHRAQDAERDEQWTVAAATYRDLLRRFPKDPDTEKWKQRLALVLTHLP